MVSAVSSTWEATVSTFREREKEEKKTKPSTAIMGCLYVAAIAIVSFLIAGFVMSQVNLYQVLGLGSAVIPVIDVPGTDIPEWVLQIGLAALIFFLIQPLVVIVVGVLGRQRGRETVQQPPNPWER
jgi:TRAP-type C4-dicarboxylate transport system permease small subunit